MADPRPQKKQQLMKPHEFDTSQSLGDLHESWITSPFVRISGRLSVQRIGVSGCRLSMLLLPSSRPSSLSLQNLCLAIQICITPKNSHNLPPHMSSSTLPAARGFPKATARQNGRSRQVKRMIKQSKDPYLALLSYRSTPLPWCWLSSPAELCMGRKIRTPVPKHLVPQWPYLKAFMEENKKFKDRQKKHFDKGHRARDLSPIPDNTDVWIKSEKKPVPGTVLSSAGAPRSYIVDTPSGQVHRNRHDLNVVPLPDAL